MLVSEFSGPLFDLARPDFCFMLQFCLWKNIWTCQHIHTREYVSNSMLTMRFLFLSSSMTCGRGKRGVCVFVVVCVCVCVYLSVCMHVCWMYKILVDTLVANTSCASAAKKKSQLYTNSQGRKEKYLLCELLTRKLGIFLWQKNQKSANFRIYFALNCCTWLNYTCDFMNLALHSSDLPFLCPFENSQELFTQPLHAIKTRNDTEGWEFSTDSLPKQIIFLF
jgi:hypothetical protein